MADTTTPAPISTAGDDEPIFGRCPICGWIIHEAFDYDTQGNPLFACYGPHADIAVFGQDESGATVIACD